MKLWIVTRHGVYMQGVVGVYSTIDAARAGLREAKDKESDDYHDFRITETRLDYPDGKTMKP